MTTTLLTLHSLLNFMRKHHYQAELQEQTQQVFTMFKIEEHSYPFFMKPLDSDTLLQLVVFLPSALEVRESVNLADENREKIVSDLARLLHILNKELDMPGFGMDEAAGAIFYRILIPAPQKKIEENLLESLIKTMEHVCKMFHLPIQALSSGQVTLHQFLSKLHSTNMP